MATIAPLLPLRYNLSKLGSGSNDALKSLVAPPYDVIDDRGREELEALHPNNVVRLILPRGEGDAKYAQAKETFSHWLTDGVLVRDEKPGFFRYDQTFSVPGPNGNEAVTRSGFLALVETAPYNKRTILPHERTLSGPKEDRLKLFRATETNFSPGFMLYQDTKGEVDALLERAEPISEFVTADGITHKLSKISDEATLRAIVKAFEPWSLLIADGHHRYETSMRYKEEVESKTGGGAPHGAHRYFMVFLCNEASPNLRVFPTHRHVHSLKDVSWTSLLEKAAPLFEIESTKLSAEALTAELRRRGEQSPTFAVHSEKESALFTLRNNADLAAHPILRDVPEVLRKTDVILLHHGVLEAILGITKEAQAAKTNLWYPQDATRALAELRAGKGQLLFQLNPTPVSDVRSVAEAGEVMPQKSTFFYPKVLTGLAIHTLEPSLSVWTP